MAANPVAEAEWASMARGESDAVPAELTTFARGALEGRRTRSELAELTFDSVLDTVLGEPVLGEPALGETARRLEFRAPALSIEVEVDGRTLVGRLAPDGAARVEVEGASGTVVSSGEADVHGRFRLVLPQGGRVRLRLAPAAPDVPLVESSWITI
jgi:hypothetical protein